VTCFADVRHDVPLVVAMQVYAPVDRVMPKTAQTKSHNMRCK
jgi:hypothetical protein